MGAAGFEPEARAGCPSDLSRVESAARAADYCLTPRFPVGMGPPLARACRFLCPADS